MKRLTRAAYLQRQHWDLNHKLAYQAGREARSQGLKINRCPNLGNYLGRRADELKDAWEKGWKERDAELREPWLPYKEEL